MSVWYNPWTDIMEIIDTRMSTFPPGLNRAFAVISLHLELSILGFVYIGEFD